MTLQRTASFQVYRHVDSNTSDSSGSSSSSKNSDTPLRKFNRLLRASVTRHWAYFRRDRPALRTRGRSVSDAGLCSIVDDDLELDFLTFPAVSTRRSLQAFGTRPSGPALFITSAGGSSCAVVGVEEASDSDEQHSRRHLRVPTPALPGQYLATGCNFTDLHFDFKCGQTTARRIVKETVAVIWDKLKDISMPEPTEESHLKTAEGFMKHANFPNAMGAIDGKHIRIIKPCHTGSEYYNYKHFFSIVLLAICDANYNFIDIDVGCYGKSSDSTIHDRSEWLKKIRQGNYNIPQPRPISSNGIPIPFSFIGDEGFALSQHLQRPYAGKHLPQNKRIYNYRLTRARRYIECTFGILSNKFKKFNRPMNVNIDFATSIVKSCCVLHNFIRKRDGYKFDHTLTIVGLQDLPASDNLHSIRGRRSELSGTAIRNIYTDYFTGEGSVPWQDSKI